ncbi:PQQ-binding-like beta-propeller repeat protein [Haloferax sp. DFSO60]|uniref:outer membrane protein assembly factor BamB family protein n=1 Tax=Haloferax sp. DFSO60 TaxID=3388652 RepID=UPI00397B4CBE
MVHRRAFLVALFSATAGCLNGQQRPSGSSDTTTTPATHSPTASPTTTAKATDDSTPEPSCNTSWNPTVRWSFETEIRAFQPSVENGTVYVGSQDDILRAVAANSGAFHWETPAETGFGSTPIASDQIVTYAGYNEVAAYDTVNGHERWSFSPPGERASLTPHHGDNGQFVFVGASQRPTPQTDPKPVYDRLYALDRSDGSQQWVVSLVEDGTDRWVVPASVTATKDRVFVISKGGELVVLDPRDGAELWRRRLDARYSGTAPPVVHGGRVYQHVGDEVYVLDIETGDTTSHTAADAAPAVASDVSYWVRDSAVVARSTDDWSTKWRAVIPDGGCTGRPAIGENAVYVPTGCYDGNAKLYALGKQDGCVLGSFEIESATATMPVVAEGSVLVGGKNGAGNVWSLTTFSDSS